MIHVPFFWPARPENWPDDDWPPDCAFPLIQAGLLAGKSIGFLPLKVHAPTAGEIDKNLQLGRVDRIIEEWLLLEYACVYLPAQQNAVVEAVGKGLLTAPVLKALNLAPPEPPQPPAPEVIPFTPWQEVEKALNRQLGVLNLSHIAREAVEDALDRRRGRV